MMNNKKILKWIFSFFIVFIFLIQNVFAISDIEVVRTKLPFINYFTSNGSNYWVTTSMEQWWDWFENHVKINIKKYNNSNWVVYDKTITNFTWERWGCGWYGHHDSQIKDNKLFLSYRISNYYTSYCNWYSYNWFWWVHNITIDLDTGNKISSLDSATRLDKYGTSFYYSSASSNTLTINRLDSNNTFLSWKNIKNVNFNYDYRLIEYNSNIYVSYIDNRTNNLALVKFDLNFNFVDEKYYQDNGTKWFFISKYMYINNGNINLLWYRKAWEIDYISFDSNLNILQNKNNITNSLWTYNWEWWNKYGETNFNIIGWYWSNLYIVTNEFDQTYPTYDGYWEFYSRKIIITSISKDWSYRYSKEIKWEWIGENFNSSLLSWNIDETNGKLTILTRSNNAYFDKLKININLQNESSLFAFNGYLQWTNWQSLIYIGDASLSYLTFPNSSYSNWLVLVNENLNN